MPVLETILNISQDILLIDAEELKYRTKGFGAVTAQRFLYVVVFDPPQRPPQPLPHAAMQMASSKHTLFPVVRSLADDAENIPA